MSSFEMPPAFLKGRQKLPIEALLAHFTQLANATSREVLLQGLVHSAADLTQCELCQLYLLDSSHTDLWLCGEWQDGILLPREIASLPSDYNDEQLLQYALCQNRPLYISELTGSLYNTAFLPESRTAWRSLLCVPLKKRNEQVGGLLLLASRQPNDLEPWSSLLGSLGACALGHLSLLQRLQARNGESQPKNQPAPIASGYGLIGDSPSMRSLYQLIGKVLHNPVSVLITGETGTGKELVARAIHDSGFRRSRPFVVQNCASLPENLLESELFGYRKGAFTGANSDRKGLFDAADTGTLFLDEIGDMPLPLQAKLLRVLQEGEVRPLGSTETHKVDVRIIAATHRNLRALVDEGRFREDLYYRLSSFPIELPPLRERGEDILRLARHFADKACALLQRENSQWSDAALAHLAGYPFPGNVRELKSLVERAVLLAEGGELLPEHFNLNTSAASDPTASEPQGTSLRERMDALERNLLLQFLRKNNGNQTLTARELELPRRTLLYRMERLNISSADV